MNCVNCHRFMFLTGVQYSCPFCGVQGFTNPNELALFSVAWQDQAPCFVPIGPIGANVLFSNPVSVMAFPTTNCDLFHP